jgi:hypothetical protein
MAIRPALRNILKAVGDLSQYNANTNVVDTEVIQRSGGLSSAEVYDCLNELESLGFIKMLQPIDDTKEKKGQGYIQVAKYDKRRPERTTTKKFKV